MKSPRFSAISTVVTPTTLSSGGKASLAATTARYLLLYFDQRGSVIGSHVHLVRLQCRSNALTETTGLDQLHVFQLVAGRLHQHVVERLARRPRIGIADLLALDVLERLDGRIGFHCPHELRDGKHVVADNLRSAPAMIAETTTPGFTSP